MIRKEIENTYTISQLGEKRLLPLHLLYLKANKKNAHKTNKKMEERLIPSTYYKTRQHLVSGFYKSNL